jgi:hypothetical protein
MGSPIISVAFYLLTVHIQEYALGRGRWRANATYQLVLDVLEISSHSYIQLDIRLQANIDPT